MKLIKKIIQYTLCTVGALSILFFAISIWSYKSFINMLVNSENINVPTEENFVLEWKIPANISESQGSSELCFFAYLRALQDSSTNDKVHGIIINLDKCRLPLSQIYEIKSVLKKFNKPIVAYSSNYHRNSYILALSANEIYLHPQGEFDLQDVYFPQYFLKTALDKLGIAFHVEQREEYKTYADSYTKSSMSLAQRKNLEELANEVKRNIRVELKERKSINDIEMAINISPSFAKNALSQGIVDKLGSYQSALSRIKELSKCDTNMKPVSMKHYAHSYVVSVPAKARIGLIVLNGEILDYTKKYDSMGNVIVSTKVEKLIEYIKSLRGKFSAFVVRINSPGGSPVASADIYETLKSFFEQQKVPVVVSMGDVVASGGYWIASGLGKIVATPYTITGSIGVVSMLPQLSGLFKKIDINWQRVGGNDSSSMFSPMFDLTNSDREKLSTFADDTYRDFIEKVSISRGIPLDKVRDVAKGKVWLAESAKSIGLVDEIGGLMDAIDLAKEAASLTKDDKVEVVMLVKPATSIEVLISKVNDLLYEDSESERVSFFAGHIKQAILSVVSDIFGIKLKDRAYKHRELMITESVSQL